MGITSADAKASNSFPLPQTEILVLGEMLEKQE